MRGQAVFWAVCVVLAVLGAVVSQSMLDFFSGLLFLGLIYDFITRRAETLQKWKFIGIEWAIAAYFVVVVLGFWINASPDAEVRESLSKFTWVLYLYVYLYALSKFEIDLKKTVWIFSFLFLIPNIYACLTYIKEFDFLTKVPVARVIGMLNSATYHAHANAIVFVFFAALIYFKFKKLSGFFRIFSLAALILFFFSIFLTFTRGIWLSLFVSTVLIFCLVSYRHVVGVLVVSALLTGAAYEGWPQFRARLAQSKISDSSSSERMNLFKVNIQMWQEYPLLGIGYRENLRRNREYWDRPEWNMPSYYITSHAHNQYLNVLSTTGVFGLVFFLCFFFFFPLKNWKLLRKENDRTSTRYILLFACLWAQVQFMIACMTDVSFEYAKIRALFLFVWALVIYLDRHPSLGAEPK